VPTLIISSVSKPNVFKMFAKSLQALILPPFVGNCYKWITFQDSDLHRTAYFQRKRFFICSIFQDFYKIAEDDGVDWKKGCQREVFAFWLWEKK
jgi:hypothetical protein